MRISIKKIKKYRYFLKKIALKLMESIEDSIRSLRFALGSASTRYLQRTCHLTSSHVCNRRRGTRNAAICYSVLSVCDFRITKTFSQKMFLVWKRVSKVSFVLLVTKSVTPTQAGPTPPTLCVSPDEHELGFATRGGFGSLGGEEN